MCRLVLSVYMHGVRRCHVCVPLPCPRDRPVLSSPLVYPFCVRVLCSMCTLVRKQGPSLAYLEEVRKHMSRLPAIDPSTPTLLITGYPNVGKSSFMNKVGGAESRPFRGSSRCVQPQELLVCVFVCSVPVFCCCCESRSPGLTLTCRSTRSQLNPCSLATPTTTTTSGRCDKGVSLCSCM
jgi:hypothetical protein